MARVVKEAFEEQTGKKVVTSLNKWSDNLDNSRKRAELNDNISQLKIFKEMGKVVKAMEDKQLDYLEALQKAKDDRC